MMNFNIFIFKQKTPCILRVLVCWILALCRLLLYITTDKKQDSAVGRICCQSEFPIRHTRIL